MNQNIINILNLFRRVALKINHQNNFGISYENATFSDQASSDIIKGRLSEEKPLMICRLGSLELSIVLRHYFKTQKKSFLLKSYKYIKGETLPFWFDKKFYKKMDSFFPGSDDVFEKFSTLMLNDIPNADILGSWLKEEKIFDHLLSNCVRVKLCDLEPYYHENPWSEALKNKKVLVVHPFTESILKQYEKRQFLFKDKRVLPDFELKTLKSVFSFDKNPEFKNWFEELDHMCNKIKNTDFDIAIIGCGPHGFPLAAFVKRLGKKSIHLGGATQILFGIKGARWDTNEYISNLYNEYWVRPLPSETPQNYKLLDNGCYW